MSNENPYGTNPQDSPYAGEGSQRNNPYGQNPPPYGEPQQPQYGQQPDYGQQAPYDAQSPQYGGETSYQNAPNYETGAFSGPPVVAEPPAPLLTAVKLMMVGAALSLISILLSFTMKDQIRQAVIDANNKAAADKKLDPSGIDTAVNTAMILGVVLGLIGVGLWLLMARLNKNGKKWARIVATVLCVLSVLSFLSSLAGGSAPALSLMLAALIAIVGIASVVFLWNKANNPYYEYKSAPRA